MLTLNDKVVIFCQRDVAIVSINDYLVVIPFNNHAVVIVFSDGVSVTFTCTSGDVVAAFSRANVLGRLEGFYVSFTFPGTVKKVLEASILRIYEFLSNNKKSHGYGL